MLQVPEILTALVHLLATGSSLLLLRRGPSRRLRRLVFAVGIMSMAQLSVVVYATLRGQQFVGRMFQVLVGLAALYALRLLYQETHVPKDATSAATSPEQPLAVPVSSEPLEPSHWLQPARTQRHDLTANADAVVLEPCTTGLLALANAVGTSEEASPEPAVAVPARGGRASR